MGIFCNSYLEQADALERAADMAKKEHDPDHEKALRKAAQYNRRMHREKVAGVTGWPVANTWKNEWGN